MSAATDPPAAAAVRFGHRRLLGTLAEFGLVGPDGELTADEEALRGAAAFLRHEVIPFARGEERALGLDGRGCESTAFEHAFLASEIEAFAREVEAAAGAERAAGPAREAARLRVARRIHRIQAILELHVEKGEDPEAGAACMGPVVQAPPLGAGRPEPAGARPPGPGGEPDGSAGRGAGRRAARETRARALTREESASFLRRRAWGVLATAAGGVPYAVPVAYGFDGRDVYLASGRGRKLEALRANPAVCLTVAEVRGRGEAWSSVVVIGEAEPVHGLRARIHAIATIRRQQARVAALPPGAASRFLRASLFRIRPRELTGRRQGG